jgi:hypothetical protein
MKNRSLASFFFVFAIMWTPFVCAFGGYGVYGFTNQLRTRSFQPVEGQIDAIEKTVAHGSDGDSYGIEVQYHYTVKGTRYSSTRLRFGALSFSDGWADSILKRFPNGHPATVYYNPRHPAEAVLLQGIQSSDLYLLLFMTPFVLAGALFWYLAFRTSRKSRRFRGLHVIDQGNITRLRPSMIRPLAIAGGILGVGSFLSVAVLGFSVGIHPAVSLLLNIIGVLVLAAFAGGGIAVVRMLTGKRDLVIDDDSRQLRLPGGQTIPYADLTSVRIDEATNFQINDSNVRYVRICFTVNSATAQHSVQWTSDVDRARQLAGYLAVRLNLPATEGDRPLLTPGAPAATPDHPSASDAPPPAVASS